MTVYGLHCRKAVNNKRVLITANPIMVSFQMSHYTFLRAFCLLFFFVLTAMTGCGNGLVDLRGKVTFSDDDSPLTTGYVYLDDGQTLARGKINADGTYTVGTNSDKDGLAPGNYRVYITHAIGPDPSGAFETSFRPMGAANASANNSSGADSRLRRMIPLIDQKFTRVETSGLSITVDRSTKEFNIKVDRPSR